MDRAEFYALTLRQWTALRKRSEESWNRRDEMTELMGAQIVAMVRRCGFVQWKEPRDATDYMPSRRRKEAKAFKVTRRRRSRKQQQEIASSWRMLMTAHSQLPKA